MKNTKRIQNKILAGLLIIYVAMTFALIYPSAKADAADSDTITIVAGDGTYGFSGDGGPATSSQLKQPNRIALDKFGNIYIADYFNWRVRKIDTAGIITTFAGNGTTGINDGGPATETGLCNPSGVVVDVAGNVYIAEQGFSKADKVDSNGNINEIAGGNGPGYSGDGGTATFSKINGPEGITVDNEGNIYIADTRNHCIRKVDSKSGIITTIAGVGTPGYSGDLGPATSAQLNYPWDIALDSNGNIYIADLQNHRIRKVDKNTGIISTVAGTGYGGYNGDGQPANAASLYTPSGVSIDSLGNIYIADATNNRIRKVDKATGIISTVADKSSAGLLSPTDVKVDNAGDLYITDTYNNQVKKLTFGRKISGNAGVEGATLTYFDGTEKTVTADASGAYSFTVPYNWSGTVAISKEGYTFSPNNKIYSNVLVDQTSQDYTADAVNYTVSMDGTVGGIITASQSTAVIGDTINLTITPEAGKQLKAGSLKYNDGTKDVAITGKSFMMPAANVIVKAEFEDIPAVTYAVNVGSVTGGSITVNSTTAVSGSVINLILTPEAGKQLKAGSLKYNDGIKDVVITGTSFTMPAANVVVTAEFETVPVPVTDKTLISIVSPSAITGVSNGTVKTAGALGLPSTITIVTSGGNLSAGITWDVNSCSYNPSSSSDQTFSVSGMVTLPTGVINTNNVSLSCTISVSVNRGSGSGGNPGSGGTGSSTGSVSPGIPADNLPRIQGEATSGWKSISEYIDTVNGGSITVDMNGSTIVKKEVLESIRGKNVTVTFMLEDGLEWVINGMEIPGSTEEVELKDLNFALTLNTDSVPKQLVENMPMADRLQLSLDYNGSFGFTAILKLPMGKNNSGRIANLFYYNPVTNKLELQSVGRIQEDGEVELQFSHASDYVIVINENVLLEQAMEGLTVTKTKSTIYLNGTKGKSLTLNVIIPNVIKEAVTDELCDMSITHKSSKPKIASISASGKIIAKKAGKTTITTTITINGIKKNIRNTIIVKKANKKLK